MPSAARLGDLIGHPPALPPVTACAQTGAALVCGDANPSDNASLIWISRIGALAAGGADITTQLVRGAAGAGVGAVVTGDIIGSCSGNVFTNGIPAARANVDLTKCILHSPNPLPIATGSSNVFINGKPAARIGDQIVCGAVIISGSGNVFIGGRTDGGVKSILPPDAGTDALDLEDGKDAVRGWMYETARPAKLEPMTYGGRQVDAPTWAQFDAKNKSDSHTFLHGFSESRALMQGNLRVERSGNNATLVGNVLVHGEGFKAFSEDALSRWDKLSYTDRDGVTYRTAITMSPTAKMEDSNISIDYAPTANGGAFANPASNGSVTFGTKDRDSIRAGKGFPVGVPAHEMGHAFFGLKDAYRTLAMPNGWFMAGVPYVGFEDSLMGEATRGTVRPADLKALILQVEKSQHQSARTKK